jgi:cytochrome c2
MLYFKHCQSCHNVEGKIKTGPTFAGMFNSMRKVKRQDTGQDDEVKADEDYLRESIMLPSAMISKMGKDFKDEMDAAFNRKIDDKELDALITWLKSPTQNPNPQGGN